MSDTFITAVQADKDLALISQYFNVVPNWTKNDLSEQGRGYLKLSENSNVTDLEEKESFRNSEATKQELRQAFNNLGISPKEDPYSGRFHFDNDAKTNYALDNLKAYQKQEAKKFLMENKERLEPSSHTSYQSNRGEITFTGFKNNDFAYSPQAKAAFKTLGFEDIYSCTIPATKEALDFYNQMYGKDKTMGLSKVASDQKTADVSDNAAVKRQEPATQQQPAPAVVNNAQSKTSEKLPIFKTVSYGDAAPPRTVKGLLRDLRYAAGFSAAIRMIGEWTKAQIKYDDIRDVKQTSATVKQALSKATPDKNADSSSDYKGLTEKQKAELKERVANTTINGVSPDKPKAGHTLTMRGLVSDMWHAKGAGAAMGVFGVWMGELAKEGLRDIKGGLKDIKKELKEELAGSKYKPAQQGSSAGNRPMAIPNKTGNASTGLSSAVNDLGKKYGANAHTQSNIRKAPAQVQQNGQAAMAALKNRRARG